MFSNNPEVIRVMIRAGARVNAQDHGGLTALMYALLKNNSVSIAEAIIMGGADVNITNKAGYTPLDLVWGVILLNDFKQSDILLWTGKYELIKKHGGIFRKWNEVVNEFL